MALALDGSNSFGGAGGGSGTSASISLTTTNSNDVIIVWAFCEQASAGAINVTSVTASGLQFAKRSAVQIVNTSNNQTWDLECWWAIAKSPLSAVSITVNFSSSSIYNSLWAFGVSGCPTPNNPWDPNSSLPAYTSSGTGTTAPVISTTRAHDMLINCDVESASGAGTPAAGSGWTIIASVTNSYELVQYDVVSATQSSLTIPVGAGVSGNIIVSVGDALTADNPPLIAPLSCLDPVRRPSAHATWPGTGEAVGTEAQFVPPIPVLSTFWQPFRDPVLRKVPSPWSWFTGTEGPFVPPIPPYGWFQPLSTPVLRKPPSPWSWFTGIEAVLPLPGFGWFAPFRDPVRRTVPRPWDWFAGIEAPFVPPVPVLSTFWQPFLDPVRVKVPRPWDWFAGIEAPYIPPPFTPSYFFQPFLDPIRSKVPAPGGWFAGIEAPFVKPIPSLAFYRDFIPPIRAKVPYPPGEFFVPLAPYVYVTPSLPYTKIPFIFPIPLFFIDIPVEDMTDWINFLVLEINGAFLAQNWSVGDPASVTLYKLVTALNNVGKWATVWTALSGQSIIQPAKLQFQAGSIVRKNDYLYNFIKSALGYSVSQMDALWATANALLNP